MTIPYNLDIGSEPESLDCLPLSATVKMNKTGNTTSVLDNRISLSVLMMCGKLCDLYRMYVRSEELALDATPYMLKDTYDEDGVHYVYEFQVNDLFLYESQVIKPDVIEISNLDESSGLSPIEAQFISNVVNWIKDSRPSIQFIRHESMMEMDTGFKTDNYTVVNIHNVRQFTCNNTHRSDINIQGLSKLRNLNVNYESFCDLMNKIHGTIDLDVLCQFKKLIQER